MKKYLLLFLGLFLITFSLSFAEKKADQSSEKVEILSAAGVTVAPNPAVIGDTIAKVMKEAA